jgi:hypothetical protein
MQPVGPVAGPAVNFQDVVLFSEEAHKEHTPGAASSVQLGGFQRVVVVQASWRITRTGIRMCMINTLENGIPWMGQ